GTKIMIAYRLHFDEANMGVVRAVREGKLGVPRAFTSFFSQNVRRGDIRTRRDVGGGALFDVGVYCVNAARYIFQPGFRPIPALSRAQPDAAGSPSGLN